MSLCSAITDVEGRICTWELGTTGACAARTCSNIISANSNADCIAWIDTCTFTGTGCITKAVCGDYTPTGLDNTAKRSYCSAILDNNSP